MGKSEGCPAEGPPAAWSAAASRRICATSSGSTGKWRHARANVHGGTRGIQGAGIQVHVDRGACVDAVEFTLGQCSRARCAQAQLERHSDVELLKFVPVVAKDVEFVDVGEIVLGCCAEILAEISEGTQCKPATSGRAPEAGRERSGGQPRDVGHIKQPQRIRPRTPGQRASNLPRP